MVACLPSNSILDNSSKEKNDTNTDAGGNVNQLFLYPDRTIVLIFSMDDSETECENRARNSRVSLKRIFPRIKKTRVRIHKIISLDLRLREPLFKD